MIGHCTTSHLRGRMSITDLPAVARQSLLTLIWITGQEVFNDTPRLLHCCIATSVGTKVPNHHCPLVVPRCTISVQPLLKGGEGGSIIFPLNTCHPSGNTASPHPEKRIVKLLLTVKHAYPSVSHTALQWSFHSLLQDGMV